MRPIDGDVRLLRRHGHPARKRRAQALIGRFDALADDEASLICQFATDLGRPGRRIPSPVLTEDIFWERLGSGKLRKSPCVEQGSGHRNLESGEFRRTGLEGSVDWRSGSMNFPHSKRIS